jgi:hypothetical protein
MQYFRMDFVFFAQSFYLNMDDYHAGIYYNYLLT